MKGKPVFLSTALAGALAAASTAHADVKVLPGNACQAAIGNEAADFNNSAFIRNVSGGPGSGGRFVVCPIVRDNHANLNGVNSVDVRVRSAVGAVTCFLESFTALGDLVESNRNETTSTVVTNLPLDINTSTNGGTYSLRCFLFPGSMVLGYRVNEF
ncbi:MAG: hypothetical protein ACT4O2_00595 [Beijerinckiaceae bacterium]